MAVQAATTASQASDGVASKQQIVSASNDTADAPTSTQRFGRLLLMAPLSGASTMKGAMKTAVTRCQAYPRVETSRRSSRRMSRRSPQSAIGRTVWDSHKEARRRRGVSTGRFYGEGRRASEQLTVISHQSSAVLHRLLITDD